MRDGYRVTFKLGFLIKFGIGVSFGILINKHADNQRRLVPKEMDNLVVVLVIEPKWLLNNNLDNFIKIVFVYDSF